MVQVLPSNGPMSHAMAQALMGLTASPAPTPPTPRATQGLQWHNGVDCILQPARKQNWQQSLGANCEACGWSSSTLTHVAGRKSFCSSQSIQSGSSPSKSKVCPKASRDCLPAACAFPLLWNDGAGLCHVVTVCTATGLHSSALARLCCQTSNLQTKFGGVPKSTPKCTEIMHLASSFLKGTKALNHTDRREVTIYALCS